MQDSSYGGRSQNLKEHFSNPASLATAATTTKWHKFTSNLMVVLDAFEAQPLSDEEGDANNIEDEAATFNIKYLTSSKLMGLEVWSALKDPSFRRHILVQCLILFDYLKAPGKNDKDLPSETMKEEIRSCEERVKKLLETTPPKGKDFLHSIEHILERERNWVWWKRDGCPPFEKQPIEKKSVQDGARKRPCAISPRKFSLKLLQAPGKNDKDLPSETMKEEIRSCEERVKKLLETTPPKGKDFLHSIEHILERERNWVWWKRDGCPPFEKQPIEKKSVQDGARKRYAS
ncbi:unnamed protein product [Ilex paraguariensis]|uniref:THO complex subunit 1 n=1 Tax=Ilex paraguariensis TaxID=185542 RepID=A0ABC8QSC7_9AQUA